MEWTVVYSDYGVYGPDRIERCSDSADELGQDDE